MSAATVVDGRANRWPLVSIAVIAVVAWGAVLLAPNARYWDDWVASLDPLGLYHDIGLPWMGPISQALFFVGPWTFKLLGLIALVAIGCLSYLIAGRGLALTRFERWLVAVLLLVLPFNLARVGVAVLDTYTWCLALFVVAWYLLVRKDPTSPGVARYLVAAALLFASYTTASLLPFTLVPLGHLALLVASRSERPVRDLLRGAGRFWYLLAAPIVFWVVRTLFFQPSGLYLDYNTFVRFTRPLSLAAKDVIVLGAVGLAVVLALAVLELRWPLNRRPLRVLACLGLSVLAGGLAVTVYLAGSGHYGAREVIAAILGVSAILTLVTAWRMAVAPNSAELRAPLRMLAVGLLLFVLGAVPYVLVDKVPSFDSWDTRNQLLLPFGTAVIALAGIRSVARVPIAGRVVGAVAVAASVLVALAASLGLVADANKQSQLTAALRASDQARGARTIVVEDATTSLNFDQKEHSVFTVLGWFRTAFHDQTRYVLDPRDIAAFVESGPVEGAAYGGRYGYRDYQVSTSGTLLRIEPAPGATWWGLLLDQPSVSITLTPVPDISTLEPAP